MIKMLKPGEKSFLTVMSAARMSVAVTGAR